jgi:hypothetical protein
MYQKLFAGNHSTWTGSGDARFMNTKGNLLKEQESVSHDLASASSNKVLLARRSLLNSGWLVYTD